MKTSKKYEVVRTTIERQDVEADSREEAIKIVQGPRQFQWSYEKTVTYHAERIE